MPGTSALVSSLTLVALVIRLCLRSRRRRRPSSWGMSAAVLGWRVVDRSDEAPGPRTSRRQHHGRGGRPLAVLARTDATGQFMLQLPPGEYILRAGAGRLRLDISRAGSHPEQHGAAAQHHPDPRTGTRSSSRASGVARSRAVSLGPLKTEKTVCLPPERRPGSRA